MNQNKHTANQLGFDFDRPAPATDPDHGIFPLDAMTHPQTTPAWTAPMPIEAQSGGLLALAIACSIQNAPLVRELMRLPIDWDFNAPFDPLGVNFLGQPGPLGHLLHHRSHGYGSFYQHKTLGRDEVSDVALAMIERGADFLAIDEQGQTPISFCASSGRVEIFQSLAGHPDFLHHKLKDIRVGSWRAPEPNDSESDLDEHPDQTKHDAAEFIDPRPPLLGHLIRTKHIEAAVSLIEHAGFPINGLDADGMLPLGYCPDAESVDTLIKLGANPSLTDAEGFNALARAQSVSDTATREKMIVRISSELKKNAKNNPALLATLQAENIAALLESARHAPKSSLLKNISAFKYDVTKVFDPHTLTTPLMAAFQGGRMASAEYLLAAGCDINAVDADGVPASSYLLAGKETPSAPASISVCKNWAPLIDFTIKSHRGYPAAVEAAAWMGAHVAPDYHRSQSGRSLQAAIEAHGKPISSDCFVASDGTTLMDAYFLHAPHGRNRYETLLALMKISISAKVPTALDKTLALCVRSIEDSLDIELSYSSLARTLDSLYEHFKTGKSITPSSADALSAKDDAIVSIFAKRWPAIMASIEATELSRASVSAQPSSKRMARL
jgi:ankyrin repeat protein